MADRPLIGDVRSKPDNPPRVAAVAPVAKEQPPEPVEPAAQVELPNEPEELTAAERYRKRLEDTKISLNEAHSIYDAVLDKGFYEEYVRIRSKRMVLRTRLYEEQLRIQTALETLQPRTPLAHDEIISRYNLAASMYEWDSKPLKHETDADFDAILALIKKMPQALVALLYDALSRFDQKVMLVFSEGATDSF